MFCLFLSGEHGLWAALGETVQRCRPDGCERLHTGSLSEQHPLKLSRKGVCAPAPHADTLTRCSLLATILIWSKSARLMFSSNGSMVCDIRARSRVLVRIERLAAGNPGDVKPVGEGVSELRIDYGPGYRVYFVKQGQTVIVLLAGGDKSTQSNRHQNRTTPGAKSIGTDYDQDCHNSLRCC